MIEQFKQHKKGLMQRLISQNVRLNMNELDLAKQLS
jgi:hypothetical protein